MAARQVMPNTRDSTIYRWYLYRNSLATAENSRLVVPEACIQYTDCVVVQTADLLKPNFSPPGYVGFYNNRTAVGLAPAEQVWYKDLANRDVVSTLGSPALAWNVRLKKRAVIRRWLRTTAEGAPRPTSRSCSRLSGLQARRASRSASCLRTRT